MKFNIILTLLFVFGFTSCGERNIPVLEGQATQFISSEEYEKFIINKLDQTIDQSPTLDSQQLYLKHITYGFSLDVRVGVFGWNIGTSSAIEFHMLPQAMEKIND